MKWEEVRELYPNNYVKLKELKSHIIGDKKYVDEIALIKVIDDPKEATKELVRSKGDVFVYHTKKESIVMDIVNSPSFKGVRHYGN